MQVVVYMYKYKCLWNKNKTENDNFDEQKWLWIKITLINFNIFKKIIRKKVCASVKNATFLRAPFKDFSIETKK